MVMQLLVHCRMPVRGPQAAGRQQATPVDTTRTCQKADSQVCQELGQGRQSVQRSIQLLSPLQHKCSTSAAQVQGQLLRLLLGGGWAMVRLGKGDPTDVMATLCSYLMRAWFQALLLGRVYLADAGKRYKNGYCIDGATTSACRRDGPSLSGDLAAVLWPVALVHALPSQHPRSCEGQGTESLLAAPPVWFHQSRWKRLFT